jgi:hypothetical protein
MVIHLHLGFHKTGSTSLQALLRANRERLPARFGALAQGDAALAPLEAACRAFDARPDAARGQSVTVAAQALAAIMAGSGQAEWLVSSEDLLGRIPSPRDAAQIYAQAPQLLTLLQDAFGAVQATVYLRDHGPWVDSLYRHLLRTRGLRMTGARLAALPKFAPGCLEAAAGRLAAVAALRVLRFEQDLDGPPGPGRGFLQAAGMTATEIAALAPVARQNPGISAAEVARMEQPVLLLMPRRLRKILIRKG